MKRKAAKNTDKKKGTRRENPHERGKTPYMPKPEDEEGMPQHEHCPPPKCPEDRNPNYHEVQQKDVA
jgi:hypothetical protein